MSNKPQSENVDATSGFCDNFARVCQSGKVDLPKCMNALADYARRNPEAVAFISIGDLAREVGVSTSSVSRFARLLGFSGFPEMKSHYKERLRAKIRAMQENGIN